jgi:hypothetical protein
MSAKSVKDLPIYSTSSNQQELWINLSTPKSERSQLEELIRTTRESLCDFLHQFKDQREKSSKLYKESTSYLNNQLAYIRSETNIIPKLAFISLSGLSGLLIGFRRSNFRKFLYSTTLATSAAALCYPQEAKYVTNVVYNQGRKQACDLYRGFIQPNNTASKSAAKNASIIKQGTTEMDNIAITSKDKVIKMTSESIKSTQSNLNLKGDKGQSSDEDKDMYTTR